MVRPAKRRRALLESNPLRNTRRELIAWPDGKFTRTLRPAVFREARDRFPDALKNSWGGGGFCGVVRCGRRCGRAKSHGYKRGAYIDVVGWLGDAWVREGGILFAL